MSAADPTGLGRHSRRFPQLREFVITVLLKAGFMAVAVIVLWQVATAGGAR